MSKKGGLGKFLAGAAIGGALGILFAPKKGSESRKELIQKTKDTANKIKNADYDEILKNVEDRFEQLKIEVQDLDKEKVLKIAKEKASVLKNKAQDIVDYAINSGAPIVEQKAQDAKKNIIDLLNATIKKLENSDSKNSNSSKKSAKNK